MVKMIWNLGIVLLLLLLTAASTASVATAQEQQTALLPQETVAAFSILDGERWESQWQATGLAKFFDNAAVKQYLNSVTRGAKSDAAWLRMILPGSDPVSIHGQFTYALIASNTGFDHLLQLDCANEAAARKWIASMSSRLNEQQFSLQTVGGENGVQIFKSQTGTNTIAFTTSGNRGLVCTSPAVLKQLLSTQFKPLVSSSEFKASVGRALREFDQPLFWWFARPLELSQNDPTNKESAENFRMLQSQGFGAFKAIGGAGIIDATSNLVVSTGYAAVQQPLRLAARILDLNDGPAPAIPKWCSAATSCGFANVRTDRFLENYSTLFDALYGEGETGVFAAVLDDLKQRNDGPQIDLQSDLFATLQPQVFFATIQGESTTPRVIGIPTDVPDRVAAAVKKLFEGDSRAINQSGPGHITWKIMPIEDGYGIKEPFTISVRDSYLFIAPNAAVLDYLTKMAAESGSFESDGDRAKLGYRIDFDKFAGRFFVQLKSKKLSKSADSFLTQLKLKESVMAADPSKLPAYESIQECFDSVLSVVGSGEGSNWKLSIEGK